MFRLTPSGQQVLLEETDCLPSDLDKTSRFRFAVVDQQLVLEFGSSKLIGDLGTGISIICRAMKITAYNEPHAIIRWS